MKGGSQHEWFLPVGIDRYLAVYGLDDPASLAALETGRSGSTATAWAF